MTDINLESFLNELPRPSQPDGSIPDDLFVTYLEEFYDGNPAYVFVQAKIAGVAYRRWNPNYAYENDAAALEDFCVVHWATKCKVPTFNPL